MLSTSLTSVVKIQINFIASTAREEFFLSTLLIDKLYMYIHIYTSLFVATIKVDDNIS